MTQVQNEFSFDRLPRSHSAQLVQAPSDHRLEHNQQLFPFDRPSALGFLDF